MPNNHDDQSHPDHGVGNIRVNFLHQGDLCATSGMPGPSLQGNCMVGKVKLDINSTAQKSLSKQPYIVCLIN